MSIKIGMIGYGNVGKAFLRMVEQDRKDIEVIYIIRSNGLLVNENGLDLKTILVMENQLYNHPDWKAREEFADVADYSVDYLVELTPTNLKEAGQAYSRIKEAMRRGIHVVTGNKGPLLFHQRELKRLAESCKVKFGISCTVGGALPALELGRFGLAGSRIQKISGILNGTTNYILTLMDEEGISYENALKRAQEEGIAETDPTLDVEGFDTAIKMVILANELLPCELKLSDAKITGIQEITQKEIQQAKKEKKRIKLVGEAELRDKQVHISVEPVLLSREDPLYRIEGKEKGICYRTDQLGDIMVSGGESSPYHAAGAVLRDIENIEKNLK